MEHSLEGLICQPGWEFLIGSDALVISCPSGADATKLIKSAANTLRDWATKFQLPVFLKAPDCRKPIKIPPNKGFAMSTSKARQDVFTAPELFCWTDVSTAVLTRMRESDSPMFLIRNSDDRQVWVNERAAAIMRSSGSECVIRRVSDYWNPADLHELYIKLRQDGGMPFQHSYKAKLNDQDIWGQLTAQYEVVDIDGVSYRISTTLNCDVIEPVLRV
jgi:PAS domain-containing protein